MPVMSLAEAESVLSRVRGSRRRHEEELRKQAASLAKEAKAPWLGMTLDSISENKCGYECKCCTPEEEEDDSLDLTPNEILAMPKAVSRWSKPRESCQAKVAEQGFQGHSMKKR